MVEPIPEIFQKLKNNCKDINNNITFKNMAITVSGSHGIMPFYVFTSNDKEQQHRLSGFSSTSKEKLLQIKSGLDTNVNVTMINVPFQSVSYYLEKNKIEELNLLVTDVEGLDIDIITEFINCKLFPNIIYMEILGQSGAKCSQLIKLLTDSGYAIGGNISDLIAYRGNNDIEGC